jgi:Ser/Thr protein kinase RdoA (MazF antagonist)
VEIGEPMPGGARNPVHRARRGCEELVVRVSGRSAASLEWEFDLLQALSEAGVTVPMPVRTDDGRRHADGVMVHRLIAGGPPRDQHDWRRVVETLRVVHAITIGWPQRPGFASARQLLTKDRGGDVDLAATPQPVANLIRRAWLPVLDGSECAVHGDLGAGNILVNDDRVALIDWDEARVDVPAFDYAHLPPDVPLPVAGRRSDIVTAGVAWETATCWVAEPDYARRRLAELRDRTI